MLRRCYRGLTVLIAVALCLPLQVRSENATCPYDLDSAASMIPQACYANASAADSDVTSCCWFVFAGYLYAGVRYANLTGVAFLPPSTASACSDGFASVLLDRGLVSSSLLSSTSCDLNSSSLADNGQACEYATVSEVRAAANLSNASLNCASPTAGNLSTGGTACINCQNAVINATLALLAATQSKEFVPCGMAATIGIWSSYSPSLSRFRSYALCMLQILQNIGGLGTNNLIPSPPPPPSRPPAAKSPISPPNSSSKMVKIAAGSASAGLLSLAAIVFLAFKIHRSPAVASRRDDLDISTPSSIATSPLPTDGLYIFTRAELKAATNGYHDRLLLGEGGAGKVYLGKLPSGQHVAIKRIYREKKVAEFYAEVAILAKLRHPNLATLVGYCLGGDRDRDHVLVYEYMAGGNLSRALFNGDSLNWLQRVRIAVDVAEGLAYLHSFPGGAVVHRDVKPTNVLLTDTGIAKLSDFGVSRIVPVDVNHVSTEVVGTMGYVDPEAFAVGHVSELTDVYSFGVVLLELVTGMRAVVPTPTGGAESIVHAARAVALAADAGSDGVESIVDARLGEQWHRPTVRAVFELACRCVRRHIHERPRMAEALAALKAVLAELEPEMGSPDDVALSAGSVELSTTQSVRSL